MSDTVRRFLEAQRMARFSSGSFILIDAEHSVRVREVLSRPKKSG